ncbi:hypothetical protein AVEN_69107-1, partial [Araneus ventricosus]
MSFVDFRLLSPVSLTPRPAAKLTSSSPVSALRILHTSLTTLGIPSQSLPHHCYGNSRNKSCHAFYVPHSLLF